MSDNQDKKPVIGGGVEEIIGALSEGVSEMIEVYEEKLGAAKALSAKPVDALKVLIQRVEYYAPAMAREGDLDDARAAIAEAEAATNG